MTKRILALRGGGIRGIIPARILAEIEARTGCPCHELFDLICGTSTGGIIALMLTKPSPATAQATLDLYLTKGAAIFSRSAARTAETLDGLTAPKYDSANIEAILHAALGDHLLGEAVTPTFVLTYDTTKRAPRQLASFDASHTTPLRAAARATSAAPTYFPSAQLSDGSLAIDGGVFANDPSMRALSLAQSVLGWDLRDIELLTLGTGDTDKPLPAASASWGLAHWAMPLFDVLLDANAEIAFQDAAQLLGSRAVLLDVAIPAVLQALDDTSASTLAGLRAAAENVIGSAAFASVVERLSAASAAIMSEAA